MKTFSQVVLSRIVDPIFQSRELVFQGTVSEVKHWRKVLWLAQNILVKQPNHATTYHTIPHTFAALINLSATPHNPFSRLIWAKYHQITQKHSAYWQINNSSLFSRTRLIQVPGCTVTRSADQKIPVARVKVHLQFYSCLIDSNSTPRSLSPWPKT